MTPVKESIELDEQGEWFWKVTFPVLSLLSFSIGFVACSEWLSVDEGWRVLTLRAFILALLCLLGAYAGGPEGFGPRLAWLVTVTSATAALYLSPLPGLASIIFYVVVIVSALLTVEHPRRPADAPRYWRPIDRRPGLRQGIVYAWAVSGTLLSVSRLEPLRHPRPGLPEWMIPVAAQEFLFTHLTDLRLIVSVVAGTFLLSTAISRAVNAGSPTVPGVPRARLDGLTLSRPLALVVRPFLQASVMVWTILRVPADMVWKVLAHTGIVLARIAWYFMRLLAEEVLNPGKLVRIVAQVCVWATLLAVVRASGAASTLLLQYLREERFEASATLVHLGAYFVAAATGAVGLMFAAAFLWLRELKERQEIGGRAAVCGSMFLLAFSVSSILLFLTARFIPEVRIGGFAHLGPVATAVFLLFGIAMVVLLTWSGFRNRVARQA